VTIGPADGRGRPDTLPVVHAVWARMLTAALSAAIVVVVAGPVATEARLPAAKHAWGCLLTTKDPGFYVQGDFSTWSDEEDWGAAGTVGGCDRKRTLLITAAVWRLTDEGGKVLVDRRHHEIRIKPLHDPWEDEVYGLACCSVLTDCTSDPSEWAVGPFYLRMVVKRKHHPGVVRLKSHVVNTPCANPDSVDPY
jgi:hypothetical protein